MCKNALITARTMTGIIMGDSKKPTNAGLKANSRRAIGMAAIVPSRVAITTTVNAIQVLVNIGLTQSALLNTSWYQRIEYDLVEIAEIELR